MTEFDEDREVTFGKPVIDTPTDDVAPVTAPIPDPPPVLVQIVTDAVDTRWTAERYRVGTEAIPIVPYQPGRRRIVIRNLGPDTVYLGSGYGVDSVYGFPIPSGASEEWKHEAQMWAVCADSEAADIGVSLDYDVR